MGEYTETPISIGSGGVLYGATPEGGKFLGAGMVFALHPPAAGSNEWTEEILHNFGDSASPDGLKPSAGVAIGGNGALYGATVGGGTAGYGTVFEMVPPSQPGDRWTESVIWSFNGSDGNEPLAGVTLGPNGAVYGTTTGGFVHPTNLGNVFQLLPPAALGDPWTENVICDFNTANGAQSETPVLVSASGSLYGTAADGPSGGGLIFELVPPSSQGEGWTEKVLYAFNGTNGNSPKQLVAFDGALYGYFGGGANPSDLAAFELQP